MAEYQEVIKHLNRMHKQYSGDTCNEECPLCYIRGGGLNCFRWTVKHAEKAEKTIMDWAKRNPVKTKRMVVEERFPEIAGGKGGFIFENTAPMHFNLCNGKCCAKCEHGNGRWSPISTHCWDMEVGT